MDWNTFWSAFGAFGQWAAAAATVAVVYLTLNSRKTKIQLRVGPTFVSSGVQQAQHVLGFSITNQSQVAVYPKTLGVHSPDRKNLIIFPDLLRQLPKTLMPGESASLIVPYDEVVKAFAQDGKPDGYRYTAFVTDTTRREHQSEFPFYPSMA